MFAGAGGGGPLRPSPDGVHTAPRAEAQSAPAGAVSRRELEDLWDHHGGSAYALACALLGDEAAAAEVVRLAMFDLARSVRGVSTEEAGRRLVRHVYRHAQEHAADTSGAALLPPVMVHG